MMSCFDEIKDRLDIAIVVEHYGVEIKRNNTCLCPFHDDHHPSAHIYPTAFHCFTCNLHLDVIGFVMEMFQLSPLDAAKKLNDDFGLGIDFGYQKEQKKHQYNESAELRAIRQKKKERFEKWEKEAWLTINAYWKTMKDWYDTYKPPAMEEVPDDFQFHPKFDYAYQHYHFADEFSLDWIDKFTDEEKLEWKWVVDKMQAFLENQKQIDQIGDLNDYVDIIGTDSSEVAC